MSIPDRRVYHAMPVIVIWSTTTGGTLYHPFRFSERDNQPELFVGREEHVIASVTEVEGGTEYPHNAGFKLHWTLNYHVWGEDSCQEIRNSVLAPQFTEYEQSLIDLVRQQSPTVQILFYPHNDLPGIGMTNDADFQVIVTENNITRTGLAQDRGITGILRCHSRNPITDTYKFAYI